MGKKQPTESKKGLVNKEKEKKGTTSRGGGKVPTVGELDDDKSGGGAARASSSLARAAADGALHMYAMDYCNHGEVYGAQFASKTKAVHLKYFEYPNILYMTTLSLGAYLKGLHEEDDSEPENLPAFEKHFGAKVVVTTSADPDEVGTYVKNRVVVYVDERNEKALYCFLDSWVKWRVTHKMDDADPDLPEEVKLIFHVAQDSKLTFSSADEMENTYEVLKEDFSGTVNIFEGHPPTFPSRPVVANIEGASQNFVNIVFSGNTKPFQSGFDAAGIGRSKGAPLEGSAYPEWFRTIRQRDLSIEGTIETIVTYFQDAVLKDSPVFVRLVRIPEKDDKFLALIGALRRCPRVRVLT
jgi:hypothetical protein